MGNIIFNHNFNARESSFKLKNFLESKGFYGELKESSTGSFYFTVNRESNYDLPHNIKIRLSNHYKTYMGVGVKDCEMFQSMNTSGEYYIEISILTLEYLELVINTINTMFKNKESDVIQHYKAINPTIKRRRTKKSKYYEIKSR
jgi:hypothetical protein